MFVRPQWLRPAPDDFRSLLCKVGDHRPRDGEEDEVIERGLVLSCRWGRHGKDAVVVDGG